MTKISTREGLHTLSSFEHQQFNLVTNLFTTSNHTNQEVGEDQTNNPPKGVFSLPNSMTALAKDPTLPTKIQELLHLEGHNPYYFLSSTESKFFFTQYLLKEAQNKGRLLSQSTSFINNIKARKPIMATAKIFIWYFYFLITKDLLSKSNKEDLPQTPSNNTTITIVLREQGKG